MTGRLSQGFGELGRRIWLNAAHQGPLPLAGVEAASEALRWKLQPHHLTAERFQEVPERLRATLGRLLATPADQIAIANSASYGLHLIAHTFPWAEDDEVLLVDKDFPSDLLPWRLLQERGVSTRKLSPRGGAPTADEVDLAIGPRTRLFCSSWVYSFTGAVTDLEAVGRVCRERGLAFVVNGSQGVGALPVHPDSLPVDALVSVGFKWLCGPYGTGLLWMRPAFRERLAPFKAYWLSLMDEADLSNEQFEPEPRSDLAARSCDVFEPASFFNTLPWDAAVSHLLEIGIDNIAGHNRWLVQRLIDGLDHSRFRLLSPAEGPERSSIVFLTHCDPARNAGIHAGLQDAGIHVAVRAGSLRVAPHLYNTPDDVDVFLEALHSAA